MNKELKMAKVPTIYEIKRKTAETCPHFFEHNTMQHFHQTLRDFRVKRSPKGSIYIYAPIHDQEGVFMGFTIRRFTGDGLDKVPISGEWPITLEDIEEYIGQN